MDDIEKLKAENSDLRTKVDNFECNEYKLIRELEKVVQEAVCCGKLREY